jgi:hypothetical protein
MAREFAKVFQGFGGGVWLFNSPAADQAFNIENMILEPDGKAYKRQGNNYQTRIPPLGAQILSLFPWYRTGSPPQLLAHGNDGKLYYTTDLVNWTESGAGAVLSTTNPACFTIAYSSALSAPAVYIADGVNKLKRWSGTALVDVTAAPTGLRYLCWWKDTLFALSVPTNLDRTYYSAATDADTWPALNWIDIGKGDGDYGTALFTAGQELVVSKHQRTFVVFSPTTLENRVADYEKGCETQFSVVKFDTEIYYITRFGVARYISGAPAEIVSNNIQPLFTPVFLNMARMDQCHGYRVHHRVGWSLVRSGQTVPDFQIEYYPQYPRKPWTFHRMPAQCWVTWRDADERLFFGKVGAPSLMEAFSLGIAKDDGVDFRGTVETTWDNLGDPVNRKYLRALRIWGEGHVHIQVRKDRRDPVGQMLSAKLNPPNPLWNEGVGDKWSLDDVWGSLGSVGTDIVYPDIYGREFSILMYDLNDEPVAVEIPNATRRVGDLTYGYPHGWSVHQLVIEAVQMGELG